MLTQTLKSVLALVDVLALDHLIVAYGAPSCQLEIQQDLQREVNQERWTNLDRTLQREAQGRLIHMNQPASVPSRRQQRMLLIERLQRLRRMGL